MDLRCIESGNFHKFRFLVKIGDVDYHQCENCGIILGSDLVYRANLDGIGEDNVIKIDERLK